MRRFKITRDSDFGFDGGVNGFVLASKELDVELGEVIKLEIEVEVEEIDKCMNAGGEEVNTVNFKVL